MTTKSRPLRSGCVQAKGVLPNSNRTSFTRGIEVLNRTPTKERPPGKMGTFSVCSSQPPSPMRVIFDPLLLTSTKIAPKPLTYASVLLSPGIVKVADTVVLLMEVNSRSGLNVWKSFDASRLTLLNLSSLPSGGLLTRKAFVLSPLAVTVRPRSTTDAKKLPGNSNGTMPASQLICLRPSTFSSSDCGVLPLLGSPRAFTRNESTTPVRNSFFSAAAAVATTGAWLILQRLLLAMAVGEAERNRARRRDFPAKAACIIGAVIVISMSREA
mmetsp:Transcript_7785/g.15197  ORF Transcript_7785/g.15197 Transcript_7785/m.15197 type:complete len:270 (+) Transcript_7785:431-1240(+)